MAKRDAETAGGSLESGTSKKESFHDTTPASLGMGTAGGKDIDGPQLPGGNPMTSAPRGQKIK